MLCGRTLHDLIAHLACSLNDREGSELRRIAEKNCDFVPSGEPLPDGVDFVFEQCEEELNHIRWSETFLTSVINDGFRILHLERPDLFTGTVRHKLTPGCPDQDLPDCCKYAGGLRNDSCNGGSKPIEVSEEQIRTSEALALHFCTGLTSNQKYVVKGFNFNPKTPHKITILPPPPFGQDTFVTFDCVHPPPCFEWDEDEGKELTSCIHDDYEPWFIEYALSRAHMTDRESESSFAVAQVHWANGFKLISDGKLADYTFYHPDLYLLGPISEGTGERIVLQSE